MNPWIAQHVSGEMAFSGHLGRKAVQAIVANEHEIGEPQNRPCDCGGQRWYRATVGAFMCPDCRVIERFDGSVIR